MDFNLAGTLCGFISCAVVLGITVVRQRQFEATDVGSFAAAYLAGSNLPAAIFLCGYALWPGPASVATKLHGLERFVSFAGLSLLLVSLVAVWGLCRKAYALADASPAAELARAEGPET